jgi:tyrosyl-tRNA synthetase
LVEVIGDAELKAKLSTGEPLKVYWGTSPTGSPSFAYFLPMIKICQLLKAGCEVTILFADLHAYLDAMKTSWDLLKIRTEYYSIVIKQIISSLGGDITKIRFIRGSDYQLTPEYTIDVYKFLSKVTIEHAQKAGAEVVKQSDNPLMSGLVYPLLQVLDEVYLGTDAELGGQDQRKIFMMSRDHLHKLGYKSNIHLMNPMIPSINSKTGEKMSSSEPNDSVVSQSDATKSGKPKAFEPNSKIGLLDTTKEIKKKINKGYLEESNTDSGLFKILELIVFPSLELKGETKFVINRDEKWGGKLEFDSFEEIKTQYQVNKIAPPDIKLGLSDYIDSLVKPIREKFEEPEMKELYTSAYN